MRHLTNYFLVISLTLLFISACTESVNQTELSSDEKFLKQIEDAVEALELKQ